MVGLSQKLVLLIVIGIAASCFAEQPSLGLYTTYGKTLRAEQTDESITLEPNLTLKFPTQTELTLRTEIDRPTNPYENYTVPRTSLSASQILDKTTHFTLRAHVMVTALDLHRWNHEGFMLRNSAGGSLAYDLGNGFGANLQLAPFYQANEYRQTTSGNTKSLWGLSERLRLFYTWGRTTFTVTGILTQRYTSYWKNDFATSEELSYQLDDVWTIGCAHEILGSIVDDSTGRYSNFRLFDQRESRLSAFVGIVL